MFLSKLTLNHRSPAFLRDIADVHDMHRTVMSGYPDSPPTATYRHTHGVLWRIDIHSGGQVIQYVQSHTAPDWANLPEGLLLRPAEVRPLQPVLDAIKPGKKFSFRLMANPTRCIHPDGTNRRKHIPLRQPTEHIEWLIAKGEKHGFVIPASRQGAPDVTARKAPKLIGKRSEQRNITIEPVRYDGHLIVTDPDSFTEGLLVGIGRAKAYGCGLLSLALARTPHAVDHAR